MTAESGNHPTEPGAHHPGAPGLDGGGAPHQAGARPAAHQGGAGGAPELDAPAHQGGAPVDEVVRDEVVRVARPRFEPGAPVPTTTLPVPLASIIGGAPAPEVEPEAEPVDEPEPDPVPDVVPVVEPLPDPPVDPEQPNGEVADSDQADRDTAHDPVPIGRAADGFRQTLGKIAASEVAARATSWPELAEQLADPGNTAVTLRQLERATGLGRKRISNALEHTDLMPWPHQGDERKEASA